MKKQKPTYAPFRGIHLIHALYIALTVLFDRFTRPTALDKAKDEIKTLRAEIARLERSNERLKNANEGLHLIAKIKKSNNG